MKRILFAVAVALGVSPALAADLPPPGPAPVAPAYYKTPEAAYYNWTGFYLGINGGYALGTSNWSDFFGSSGDFNANGFLIGGTVGANYQWGNIVFGIEADGDWSNLDGSTSNGCFPNCETKSNWLATVRGRMGYAWDRLLVYTTAGGAFANVQAGAPGGPYNTTTQAGWTAGVGVEGAFAPNWTARVEYLFVDLSNQSCGFSYCGGNETISLNENIVRAGIDYKFAW